MKRATCLALLLVMAAAPGSAAQRELLGNGLTVLVQANAASDVVTARLITRVSVLDEPDEGAGVRYLTQQLLLRGSAGLDGTQVAGLVDNLGATLEVGVETELVYTEINAPSDCAAQALALLAQVVERPALAPEELELARQQALLQLQLAAGDPGQRAQQLFLAGLYGGHPYGRSLVGTAEGLAACSRERVAQFHRAHYLPNRSILVICGRVAAERAYELAAWCFGAWAPGMPPSAPARPVPALAGSRMKVEERPVLGCYLMLGFRAPGVTSPDYPALLVLDSLLGKGMGSRLYLSVRDRAAIAYRAQSVCGELARQNYYALLVVTGPGSLQAAKDMIVREVGLLQEQPIAEVQMQRARRFAIGTYLLEHQRNRDLARYLGWYEALGLGSGFDQQVPALVERVTAEDVARVARTHFGHYFVSVLVPRAMPQKDELAVE